MKIYCNGKDITKIVTSSIWSGDLKQAARVLDFGVAVSPSDYYLPSIDIKMGDLIKLEDSEGEELFQGYVFTRERSSSNEEMRVTAYDGLIYLLKSKGSYNFKNMTPQAITSKVCGDFQIPIGALEEGKALSRLFDAESIYNIIMTAYTIESGRSEKPYIIKMDKGNLNVIEKGKRVAKYVLDTKTTIIDASYGESIEDSINKVKIYDEKGNYLGDVSLDGVPGILQDIYVQEKGKDTTAMAKAMLRGIGRTASIEALGDVECITGNAVEIKEPYTGLSGLFYIDNDQHNFSDGIHTMSLGLSFKNIMDTQEGGGEDEN